MSGYEWEAIVTVRDKETKEVIGTLEGWQLTDTTFYGIENDVIDFVHEYDEWKDRQDERTA